MAISAATSLGEYHVFLNFRREDACHEFIDMLYHQMVDAGIHVFKDEEELTIGEVISERLQHAIKNTIIYIPIFSQTYASNKWCLRELKLMVDTVSKSQGRKSIIPIFLNAEPDDVILKKPLYEADFKKHEEDFHDEVEAWKGALRKVDEFKGWVVKKDQSQAAIVESFVETVLVKLKIKQKLVPEYLIGVDDQVKELINLIDVNDDDVRLIGIYGMGGIGKTTIARVIFNSLLCHFGKNCSFLEGVRERLNKEGIVQLQKKLLYDIGFKSIEKVKNPEQGMRKIGEILSDKKVLVVLDDVHVKHLIKNLIGNSKLYSGSRIIITTRDTTVLQEEGFKGKIQYYEMRKMADDHAFKLFCWHAFYRDFPFDDYHELSSEIVSSMGGLPLAIEVVGSLLNGKDKAFWEETCIRLRNIPEREILMQLKISYDGLEEHQKQIFLDIACFFFNKKKTEAIYLWADCDFFPIRGIHVLKEKCLIKILDNDILWMHDQLIALGRQIVREDSVGNLGKQSRLWIEEEAVQIIRTKEKKAKVQALEIFGEITNEEFERLPNLRFLTINSGTYVGDFASCCLKLRWFSWYFPPEKDFGADHLYMDQLVVCKLYGIDFKDDSKAWDLIKRTRTLKILSLDWCSSITTIPDISNCLGLEIMTLASCSKLKRIESFIGNLQSLIKLKIKRCGYLTDLPEEIGALVELRHFSLSGCQRLRELPSSIGNLISLRKLNLSDTVIRELPNSIGELKSLCILRFPVNPSIDRENHDWQLPSGINELVNLKELDLSRRNLTGEIPHGIEEFSYLRILDLESTYICKIPKTINKLRSLQKLNLWNCNAIQELPELPTSLNYLRLESKSLLSVPNLSNLAFLVELQLSNGSGDKKKPKSLKGCNLRGIERLSLLKKLWLNLLDVTAPPELASLSCLEELVLRHLDLKPLVQLSSCYWRLTNLSTLEIGFCEVEDIPLEELPRLKKLIVDNCIRLQRLSIPLGLRELWQVRVSMCPELVEIQVVGLSKSLESLIVDECKSLTRISGLSYLKNLETLRIEGCKVLTYVEDLDELESLKSLEVSSCMSLRWRIDAPCTKIPDDCIGSITRCGYSIKDSRSPHGISASPKLASLSHLQELTMLDLDPKPFVQLPSFDWSWRNLLTLEFYYGEVEDLPLDGLQQLEILTVDGCKRLQRLSIPSGLRKLRQAHVSMCPELVEMQVVGLSKSLKSLIIDECKSLTSISGLSYLKNLERMKITGCNALTNVEGLDELESLKFLEVKGCLSLRWLIDASCTRIPNDCLVIIKWCGDSIKNSKSPLGMSLKHYKKEILLITSNKDGAEFDISGLDEYSNFASLGESETDGTSSIDDFQSEASNAECFEATRNRRQMRDRRIEHYGIVNGGKTACMENGNKDKDETGEPTNPNEVVWSSCQRCEGVEHYERSCNATTERDKTVEAARVLAKTGRGSGTSCASNPGRDPAKRGGARDIAPNSKNNKALRLGGDAASTSGKVTTSNFGRGIASSSRSQANLSTGRSKGSTSGNGTTLSTGSGMTVSIGTIRCSDSRRGTIKTGGSSRSGPDEDSSIDDFQSELGNADCFEATGNRRQMRDRRIQLYGSVNGGKRVSTESRKKDKVEIGDSANQNNVIQSSCQRFKVVEHCERSYKAITKVEDQRDLPSVKRNKTVETDRVPAKIGRGSASDPGGDPTERARERAIASSSRNGKVLRLDRDATSTLGKGTKSNSGKDKASTTQSSAASSSGRSMTLSLRMGRVSTSRMDTTKMGTTSSPGSGITSCSQSSAIVSTGRGKGSISGKGTIVSLGWGTTMNLGRGMTKTGTSLRSGMNKGSSSAKAEPQIWRS